MTTSEEDDDLGIKELAVCKSDDDGLVVDGQSSSDDTLGTCKGSIIESSHTKYTVIKMLGEGGFGAVYLVEDASNSSLKYALKVERKLETRRDSKWRCSLNCLLLAVESEVGEAVKLSTCDKHRSRLKQYRSHLYILEYCLRCQKKNIFRDCLYYSLRTNQYRRSASDRDIEARLERTCGNYAIGLGEQVRVIYILDFGIARKILNDKGEIKTPRVSVAFKGTVKFAAIACHKRKELGPKDDCESWFYLLLDLEECRNLYRDKLFHGLKCKDEFGKIMDYIDSLHYEDRVDYSFIYEMLRTAAAVCDANLADPYDWEETNVHIGKSRTKSSKHSTKS
uniref:Protein kinase domain-containing protein n=1 Tax=Ascaris lumbricoides TaxID=6252 RepID=A0A0M3IJP7_ASCLU